MTGFGDALRAARKAKGWSRGRLYKRILAKFGEDAMHKDTPKQLELQPTRDPQDWVREQLEAILPALRKIPPDSSPLMPIPPR